MAIRFDLPLNGVLVIDKPEGITSFDVVRRIRRLLDVGRVGHLGTLDPAATGVLPLTLGKTTRLARFIPSSPKEYTGEVRLGWSTTTCDLEGTPLEEPKPIHLGSDTVRAAMQQLTGHILQVPPAYSAKKIRGVRAYRLARSGRPVDLKPVPVEVLQFELLDFRSPQVAFKVVCSEGTYVRSLARDLGEALGTGGHLFSLRRVRSGDFQLHQAVNLEKASAGDVIPAEQLMDHLTRWDIGSEQEAALIHGRRIRCDLPASTLRIFNKNGYLIAIATVERGWAQPRVVLL